MHRYHVTAIHDEGQAVSLRDSAGRFHVARAMAAAPAVGTNLAGSLPGLGYRVLLCSLTSEAFRLTFERIDCGPPSARLSL
jgi:hypothetical protein